MEWVEVQADTLEAAKERALDKLGVALDDAEFEIVQVPESRWMGLKKTEARVRARVRPTTPRPKKETRPRRRRGSSGGDSSGGGSGSSRREDRSRERNRSNGSAGSEPAAAAVGTDEGTAPRGESGGGSSRRRNRNRNRNRTSESARSTAADTATGSDAPADTESTPATPAPETKQQRTARPQTQKEAVVSNDASSDLVPADEQQEMVVEFLSGLVDAFGLSAEIGTAVEDDTVTADVRGSGLGVLVGPKGGTIRALQEVTRAAAQRHADGRDTMRINVDVAGYRERRREALTSFALKQAEVVKSEDRRVAFEPMGSADRKIIHDAILEVDGVRSISEGDEPRRRVVLLPDND